MDVEENAVKTGDHVAELHLYDPSTPFRCPSEEVLRRAEAFWIGPITAKSTLRNLTPWPRPKQSGFRCMVHL